MDPFFSELYISSSEEKETLNAELRNLCSNEFDFHVDPIIYRNEVFDASALEEKPYDFIRCSQFRVEIEMVNEDPISVEQFHEGIANIILKLRAGSRFVVETNIEPEDFISKRTGWNWTEETPEPLGRVVDS